MCPVFVPICVLQHAAVCFVLKGYQTTKYVNKSIQTNFMNNKSQTVTNSSITAFGSVPFEQ